MSSSSSPPNIPPNSFFFFSFFLFVLTFEVSGAEDGASLGVEGGSLGVEGAKKLEELGGISCFGVGFDSVEFDRILVGTDFGEALVIGGGV